MGGEINAYTSFDQTVYHITLSGRFLENALDILADTLGNSVFDPGELSRELEVILEEVRMNEDNPGRVVSNALFREAYKVHPYGRPVIGYVDTIRKTTREDLLAYFHANYVPGNMVLVIAGSVDPKTSRPLIEKTFGQLPPGSAPESPRPAEPPQRETRVVVKEKDARRAYLEMGFHGPSMKDPDVYAWDLLSMILGSGETSRLYRGVKDGKGLVDSVSASSYTPRDPGLLFIDGTLSPEKARAALKEILLETFRMTAAPPEGAELARAKTATETDFLYSLESQSAVARHVGFYETTLNDAAFEQTYLRKIRAVTADDIQAVAKKYLAPGNLTVSAVLPAGQGGILPAEEVRAIAREAYAEATAPAAKTEKKRTVVKEVLGNGIRVIVRENRAVPVVAVQAGFLAGVRGEPKEKGGVANLTAGMLVKGTAHRTAREISEAVENMGADLNGYSGRNSFGLQGKFLQRDFEKGFRLFAESLLEPTFPAEELEKKRIETLGVLKQQKDQLTQATFLLFLGAQYGDHPYGTEPPRHGELGPRDDARGSESVLRAVGGPAEHGDRDLRGHRRGGSARGGPQGVRGDAAAAGIRGVGGVAGPFARCGDEGGRAARQAAGALRHRIPRGAVHRSGPVRARRSGLGARRDGRPALREPEGQEVAGLLGHLVFLGAGGPGLLRVLHGDERGQAGRRDRRHPRRDRRREEGWRDAGRSSSGRRSG